MDTSSYLTNDISKLRKNAERGDADAQYHLGGHYKHGLAIPKNLQQAAYWYECAAKQGHIHAAHNLAVCYDSGEGVKKDPFEAVKWYKCAAEKGHDYAQHNLALCYYNGQGISKDLIEAAKWFKKAAEQGIAASQFNYGSCCFHGEGITKDEQEGLKWISLAAESGHRSAISFLHKWQNNNPSEEILINEKEVELNQKTISFFNGFTTFHQQWKDYPATKLAGKYIGHKVQFFTMPADAAETAKSFTQHLKEAGFDAELKAAKDKPSIVVDLTTSNLTYNK